MTNFTMKLASPEQIAIWEAERLAEYGPNWGDGKTQAEIDAEVERRVNEWQAERDAEKAREAALAGKSVADYIADLDADFQANIDRSMDEIDAALKVENDAWEALQIEQIAELAKAVEFAEYKAAHPHEAAEAWASTLEEYKAYIEGDDNHRELKIADRVDSLLIDQEARRRVAAQNYDGLGGLLSWDDLEDMGALAWLVPGWLPMGETAFLVAKRNLGKSMFALALGFSVALGLDFLGLPTTQGKVLFVLGEGSRGFMKRLNAWALANHVKPEDLKELVAVYRGGKINNDQSVADMTEAVRKLDPVLVVIDTYSSLSGVVNEIDAAENAEVLNRIKRIAPEAATLILAHPNAETESTTAPKLRGTTVLSSNVDTVITMWRDKDHKVAGRPFDDWLGISTAESHAGKQKDDSNKTLHGLSLLTNAEGAYLDFEDAAGLSKADQWVRDQMAVGVKVTVNDLIASSLASRSTVRAHLRTSSLVVELPSASGGANEYQRSA